MAIALNRAQIRDRVRRVYLGITPPIDPQPGTGAPVPGAQAGDAPTQRPDPSNAVLNDCLEMAVADLCRKCDYHENRVEAFPVAAYPAGFSGPAWVGLQEFLGSANLRDIKRVVWTDSTHPPTLLQGTSWQTRDRLQQPQEAVPCGLPVFYLLQGYELGLLPAPTAAGTLSMLLGTSPYGPVTDQDILRQLPVDFHEVVFVGAAIRSLSRIAEDAEAQAKLSTLVPVWLTGVGEVMTYKNGALRAQQPSFGFASYRVGAGLRRNRR